MVESHYDNDLIHLFRSPLCHRDSGFERGLIFFFFNDTATTEIYTLSPTRRSSDLPGRDDAPPRPAAADDQPPHARPPPCLPDRKSTRLNSSHQIISYAVFCLKK